MNFKDLLAVSFIALQMTALSTLQAYDQALKEADVYKLMEQVFQQHLDQKGISVKILKDGFEEYINQFDPYRLYLLEAEVHPYLFPTQPEIAQFIEQYKKKNLSSFEQLNALIRKSIERARNLRKEIIQSQMTKNDLFINPGTALPPPLFFAKNAEDLKIRIIQDMKDFIRSEISRIGKDKVLQDKAGVLNRYDFAMRKTEAPYMGTEANGTPLSAKEQDRIFAMHILKALTSSLDAHSKFLDSREAFDLRIHLEKAYRGIGIEIKKQGADLFVNRLIEGGPADKSGQVKVHDKILRVDGHDVADIPLEQVLDWLRDTSDPIVEIVLLRTLVENDQKSDKKVTVKLLQSEVAVNEGRVETSYEKFDDGIIGRIILHSFYRSDAGVSSEKDVRAAIKKLKDIGNLKGLILDLRDNTGGFLGEAIKVAGLFITSGIIVISKYSNGEQHIYRDVDGKVSYNGPLIVLTSRETASAAEIVAQALQDYGIALVVGDEHTYGKGTIQSQTVTDEQSDKPYFKVTVGKYYTVSGKTPQGMGIKADLIVPSPLSEMRIGEEFLEHIETGGTITASYEDNLKDLDPAKQEWYIHYYTPSLQHKVTQWRAILPKLQKKSNDRIAQNRRYQELLVQLKTMKYSQLPSFNSHIGDLQLEEAYHIVEDMITAEK